MTAANSNVLVAAGAAISRHSAELRKELGFRDLVFALILAVIVPDFFGTAVKAGPAHVVLWLLAVLLFFIPQALLVAHLNRLMPLEGGLYEWARLAFGDRVGFLVAWNLWLFGTLYTAVIGLVATTFVAYAVGPESGERGCEQRVDIAGFGGICDCAGADRATGPGSRQMGEQFWSGVHSGDAGRAGGDAVCRGVARDAA